MKKKLSILTISMFLLVCMSFQTFAANYSDISNHWAKSQINTWKNYGIITDSSNKFRPDDFITRGEIAILIDNLMGYRIKSSAKFSDLGQSMYTEPMLRANQAGIIGGSNGQIRPRDKITREEASVLICKAFNFPPSSSSLSFSDSKNISSWAKGYVSTLVNKGYISGRGSSRTSQFDPKGNITRAEAITILDNIVKELYNKSQTYSNQTIDGTAVINTPNVKLKNIKIKGDLIVAEGVGDGDLNLSNVKISGTMIVKGGGTDSIHIEGSSDINKVQLIKSDSSVRLNVADSATVKSVVAENSSDDIIVSGNINKFEVDCSNNKVAIVDGKIKNMVISSAGATVAFDSTSQVDTLAIAKTASNAKINGEGSITNATINATGTTFIANDTSKLANLTVANTALNTKLDIRGEITKLNINAVGILVEANGNSNIKSMKVIESGKDSNIEVNGILKNLELQAEGSIFTATDSAKVDTITVESDADYCQLYIKGKANTIDILAPNTELSVEGEVTNVNVEKSAENTKVFAERYSKINSVKSQAKNVEISGTGKIESVDSVEIEKETTTKATTVKATTNATTKQTTPTKESTIQRQTETTTEKQTTKATEPTTEEAKLPSISERSVLFDKSENMQQDIEISFDLGKGELAATDITSVVVAGNKLDLNDGYSVAGNQITIYKDILSTLKVGNKSIVITFDDEFLTSETVILTVVETASNDN